MIDINQTIKTVSLRGDWNMGTLENIENKEIKRLVQDWPLTKDQYFLTILYL